jgi:hypothetical protein
VVEAEIEAEQDEDAGGDGFCQATIEIHGLEDPVAVPQVPDKAADVTECGPLAEGKWIFCLAVIEKCRQKRQKRDPAEGRTPDGSRPGDRERKNLEDAREYGQGPKPQGDQSHRI